MAIKVTDGGQVTIPKWAQDELGGPGAEVVVRRAADGAIVLEKAETEEQPATPLRELVGNAGPGLSTDEIMAMTRGDAEARQLHPGRFAEAIGSAGPGPSTDELMMLLRGEPE